MRSFITKKEKREAVDIDGFKYEIKKLGAGSMISGAGASATISLSRSSLMVGSVAFTIISGFGVVFGLGFIATGLARSMVFGASGLSKYTIGHSLSGLGLANASLTRLSSSAGFFDNISSLLSSCHGQDHSISVKVSTCASADSTIAMQRRWRPVMT